MLQQPRPGCNPGHAAATLAGATWPGCQPGMPSPSQAATILAGLQRSWPGCNPSQAVTLARLQTWPGRNPACSVRSLHRTACRPQPTVPPTVQLAACLQVRQLLGCWLEGDDTVDFVGLDPARWEAVRASGLLAAVAAMVAAHAPSLEDEGSLELHEHAIACWSAACGLQPDGARAAALCEAGAVPPTLRAIEAVTPVLAMAAAKQTGGRHPEGRRRRRRRRRWRRRLSWCARACAAAGAGAHCGGTRRAALRRGRRDAGRAARRHGGRRCPGRG